MSLNENLYSNSRTSPVNEPEYTNEIDNLKLELQLYKNQFNTFFENPAYCHIIVDNDYTIININKTAAELFGYESVILKNSSIVHYFHDVTKKKLIEIIDDSFLTGIKRKFDFVFQLKTHEKFFFQIEASKIENEPFCLLSFPKINKSNIEAEELTNLESSLIALKELHNQTNQILNSFVESHFVLDNEYKITDINTKTLKDNKLERNLVIGKNYWEVFPEELGTEIEHHFRNSKETNTPSHFEFKSSKDIWNEYHTWPTKQGLLVYFRNITDKKKYEESLQNSELIYRALGESIDYGIWICDPEGNNLYASDTFLKLVGLTQEECSRFGWSDVLHPDDAERTIEAWKKCVKDEGKWDIEHRYRGVDGNWHYILARGVPVKDKNGKIICWAGINLDIDQQKQIQQELQKSKEREQQRANELEVILDAIPAVVWISKNTEVTEVYGNKTANELLQVNKNQNVARISNSAHAKEIKFFRNGEEIPIMEMPIFTALRGKMVLDYEMDLVYPDDNAVNLLGNASPIFDKDGNLICGLAAFINVTALKNVQKHLAESERKFSQLANAIPQLSWISRPDGFRTWYNDRWYEFTGTTFDQMQGWGWLKMQDPEHLDEVVQTWKEHLSNNQAFEKIHPLRGKDGTYRQFLTRVVPLLDKNGNVVNWFGTNTDITEIKQIEQTLKENQEKYHTLFELLPLGLQLINKKGETVYRNEKFRKYFPEDEKLNLVNIDYSKLNLKDFPTNKVLSEKKFISNIEFGVESSGKIQWFNASAAPMPGNQEFIIAYNDISERFEHDKELQDISDQLAKLNHTKDKLFVIIAHDLRNPFTSLMGFSEILINQHESYSPDEIKKYLGIIYDSAKQAHNLLENLLNWSRSQTGALEIKPEKLDIKNVIVSNIKLAHNIALKKDINISLHFDKNLSVIADKNTVDVVVRNLLSNAIKFSYPGGKINVSIIAKKQTVEVLIKDFGVGINKHNLSKLFNIENKFTSLGTNKEKGSGLGLVLCREFIEKNNGTISISSDTNKGCTVSISLPRA